MANRKNITTVTDGEYRAIEEWKNLYKTSDAVFAGVTVKQNWSKGKQATSKEYTDAVDSFLKSKIGGKR